MVTVAIHQPQYLPWLPYFAKAASCDVFVYLDNVQYQKNGVQNRNQIKTATGAAWLTVPVRASLDTTIQFLPIDNTQSWSKKHVRSIENSYAKAPYLEQTLGGGLKELLTADWACLADLNIAVTDWLFQRLNIASKTVRASELEVTGAKDDLVLSICKATGATTYLSGKGAKAYQDDRKFEEAGIVLRYHEYSPPSYQQCHSKQGFVPGLCALDALLNIGPAASHLLINN